MGTSATPGEFSPLPTTREERGRQIAELGGIRELGAGYVVPSQSTRADAPPTCLVDLVEQTCTCPDYELRHLVCKHQEAVLFWLVCHNLACIVRAVHEFGIDVGGTSGTPTAPTLTPVQP